MIKIFSQILQLFFFIRTTITSREDTNPPATGSYLQETLQGEEHCEGGAGGLHHVGLLVCVTSELEDSHRVNIQR